ncbi:Tetraacyldisaccharide 4'-kinase [Nitrospina gracilis 3/211]|uniref:Tetraacyldisaccharide 4'-kinase n=1 Tax=Nitrospina gracilis (strain 3/211) TaxID=1266370 RepID=M1ZAJ1_NITG3|nr:MULTISPECIES: tetraacyldisaccharide 4'-kinase [Nitrospina]MCF8723241.1 tetraacyldisaccharide 4'-kinase [Nitrospina sp. Nb-3]CCQ90290.1 Tetraacyldisaccharide 4'-kinase [Nitrospina gracilis 3/211]
MSIESLFYQVISPGRRFYHVPLYLLLRSVSVFYGLAQKLRVACYRMKILPTRKLEKRVISVGNLTLGGTGKTPTVVCIAEILKRHGYRPAVLSRGYGGESPLAVNVVSDGRDVLMSPAEAGDEPVMMARRLEGVPVLTAKSRYASGRFAIDNLGADVLILDDGYQHLPLYRDLNIILCDHQDPFGNGCIFPAGELREPLSQIERADVICLTRYRPSVNHSLIDHNPKQVPVIATQLRPIDLIHPPTGKVTPLSELKGRRVGLFCGIGNPADFKASLEALGAEVVAKFAFPDHYAYRGEDLKEIETRARKNGAELLVTTEKDAVKFFDHAFELPWHVLRVALEVVEGEEAWLRLIVPEHSGERVGGAGAGT